MLLCIHDTRSRYDLSKHVEIFYYEITEEYVATLDEKDTIFYFNKLGSRVDIWAVKLN